VGATELEEMRADPAFEPRIEQGHFSLTEHEAFVASIAPEAKAFQSRREQAFREERDRWGEYVAPSLDEAPPPESSELPQGATEVRSPISASVWKVQVEPGQQMSAGEPLLILEAMKMEVAVAAPSAGEVLEVRCVPGAIVHPGQTLAVFRPLDGVPA
jgi:urea carboxylase